SQFEYRVLVLHGVEIRFQRWGRRAENNHGMRHLGAHDRNIAGMVARRFFLLVRAIVFFVDDDEREVGNGSKYGRSRTDHDSGVSAMNAVPLLSALAIRQSGVQDGYFFPEHLVKIRGDRRG